MALEQVWELIFVKKDIILKLKISYYKACQYPIMFSKSFHII